MTKDILYTINVSLDAYSVMISLIIAGSIILYKNVEKYVKWFAITNLAAVLYGISDIFMWISEGTDASWKLVALPVSSFIFFLSGIMLFFFYIGYIINYYREIGEIKNSYMYFCIAMVIIYVIFLIITPITNNGYYIISEENTYSRGKLFNITVIIEAFIYIEALLLILKYHKNVQNFENLGFASFIFVPFICQIVQIMNFGIALNSVGLSISFFIIFLNLNHKMQKEYEQAKIEYEKMQQNLSHHKHESNTAQNTSGQGNE